jgi:y4mF family transcriptional regulator
MDGKLPVGNSGAALVKSSKDLGQFIKDARKSQGLTQLDVAGLGNTGNRLIVDIENGKPTVQLQKVLELMDLLGLELVARKKGGE